MNRSPSCWTGLAITLALTACQPLASGAKEKFSEDHTCPENRVESRDRPDLRRSSFAGPAAPTPQPPANIAADPERLAMWQKSHRQDPKQFDGDDDVEEARGCGKQAFYFCHHSQKYYAAWCSPLFTPVPATISHW